MKVTSKGQVTIPQDVRRAYGLLPHTEVEFVPMEGGVKIVKAGGRRRGRRLVERLAGRGDGALTTDQIMALTRGEG